jgi:hypothetical protein
VKIVAMISIAVASSECSEAWMRSCASAARRRQSPPLKEAAC